MSAWLTARPGFTELTAIEFCANARLRLGDFLVAGQYCDAACVCGRWMPAGQTHFLICGALWSTVEHCGALWSTVEHCGVLRSTVEHCGALWSTVEHCGALWSTVEHCALQGWWQQFRERRHDADDMQVNVKMTITYHFCRGHSNPYRVHCKSWVNNTS